MPDADKDEEDLGENRRTLSHRVRLLERDVRNHSHTLTSLVEHQSNTSKHLRELEEFRMERLLAAAREDERDKSLGDRLTRIEASIDVGLDALTKQINAIKAVGVKLGWIIIGAVVPGVLLGVAYLLMAMVGRAPFPPTL